MGKSLLCKFGFHKPDPYLFQTVTRQHWPSGKKYRRNYIICRRCGKRLWTMAKGRRDA